jgi:hypothetical protein
VQGVLDIVTHGLQHLKTNVLRPSPHVKVAALAMVKGPSKARVGVCQHDLARSSSGELAKLALVLVADQAIERISSNDDRWPSLLSVNRG